MPYSKSGYQLTLEDVRTDDHIVNVASVPQRSPFRYPGGKTWLVPRVRQWLPSLRHKPSLLVEPFAGGAIVGLTAVFEDLAEHVMLVELDGGVAAVWESILNGDSEWLVDRIITFNVTEENVRAELSQPTQSLRDIAFQTILKNRTFHGGILAPGSNVIKFGENGKGIRSRWYPQTLAKRIQDIASIRHRITFVRGDGMAVISEHASMPTAAFFIDPPYTAAGKKAGTRMYTYHTLDHNRLFDITAQLTGDFLMTYDNASEVSELAVRHGFRVRTVSMKNTHHASMTELLLGRDLGWLR